MLSDNFLAGQNRFAVLSPVFGDVGQRTPHELSRLSKPEDPSCETPTLGAVHGVGRSQSIVALYTVGS